jgi:hypothetical protein
MTLNEDNNDYSLASEHWIEAYNKSSHVDIESFEVYSAQFFEQVDNQAIDAKNLIGKLCIYTFSSFAISSTAKYTSENNDSEIEEIPFLTVILHPFKESRSITFGKKEVLFGILADDDNPKKEVKTLEFVDPLLSSHPGPLNYRRPGPNPKQNRIRTTPTRPNPQLKTPAFEPFPSSISSTINSSTETPEMKPISRSTTRPKSNRRKMTRLRLAAMSKSTIPSPSQFTTLTRSLLCLQRSSRLYSNIANIISMG